MENENRNLFQVNLKGIISLLSEHIYSNPATFVRELLQNSIDAITALRGLDENYAGTVRITLAPDYTLTFTDNGIGLKEEEIHRFLTVIGESSKRDVFEADDFIGKFGIGLLSCFVVSNEIVVETRSALSPTAVRWCGKVDGTYTTTLLEGDYPIGSKVILTPKKEWRHLFGYDALKRNLQLYGQILPYPVYLQNDTAEAELINEVRPVWLQADAGKSELLDYGKKVFQSSFMDAFPIRTEQGGVEGVLYILPYKTQFSGKTTHKIYLKRMFLSDNDCYVLPPWAFFVKAVLNCNKLQSTASREALVNNDALREARKEVGAAIKSYLKGLISFNPELFDKILNVHYLHIKAIAAEDDELLKLYMDHLPFETNKGFRSFGSIRKSSGEIHYTSNIDDFKQVRRIAGSQGLLVVNAAYTFDETLLKKMERLCGTFRLKELTPASLLNNFVSVSGDERPDFAAFEQKSTARLKKFGCLCRLKHFTPADTPVIFIAGEKETEKPQAKVNNPLLSTLGAFTSRKSQPPTLCFNIDNELVQTLVTIDDEYMFHAIIDILYVQSLLLGKYPVNDEEMHLFNESLYSLIVLGMNNIIDLIPKK